ncbi:MAG: (2Fe-2S) ferredoxin domain-containing protein [Bdellovibrionales bacterium]|nr:(2Fe-2S) ferredoxin domain-containing protein [Bdellovibrionales bacterium]
MTEKKLDYDVHVFVCTNQKDKGESCGAKGGADLRSEVKASCKKNGWEGVRINAAGCLGHCEMGIAAVVYPAGDWFVGLGSKDTQTLVSAVEAQLIPQSELE